MNFYLRVLLLLFLWLFVDAICGWCTSFPNSLYLHFAGNMSLSDYQFVESNLEPAVITSLFAAIFVAASVTWSVVKNSTLPRVALHKLGQWSSYQLTEGFRKDRLVWMLVIWYAAVSAICLLVSAPEFFWSRYIGGVSLNYNIYLTSLVLFNTFAGLFLTLCAALGASVLCLVDTTSLFDQNVDLNIGQMRQ